MGRPKYEVGIHPNFNPNFEGLGINYKEHIDQLLQFYPNSKGVRFHSLGHNAHVIKYCADKGIEYDSSIFLPYQVPFFKDYGGIYRIPFQIADLQKVIDDCFTFPQSSFDMKQNLVLAFHPIHVYLNTMSVKHYEYAKIHTKPLHSPDLQ